MSCLLQFQLRYCEIVYVSFQAEVDFLHIFLHYILCSFVGRRIWESFYSLKSPIKGVCGLSNFLGKMWNVKCKEEVKKIAILFGKDTLLNQINTKHNCPWKLCWWATVACFQIIITRRFWFHTTRIVQGQKPLSMSWFSQKLKDFQGIPLNRHGPGHINMHWVLLVCWSCIELLELC